MAATVFFMAITLLRRASADNYSTTMHLPNMFFGEPNTQTFVGEMNVTASTTYYALSCDSGPVPTGPLFWPGPSGCINHSYTFSASSSSSRFLIPNINVGQSPWSSTSPYLQLFNQTITIDCGPLNIASTASCAYTALTNSENTDDKSIISPTLVYHTSVAFETGLYRVLLTSATVATAAAAAVSTSLVFKTSTAPIPTSSPAPASTTITSSILPMPNISSHPAPSSGPKASIGIDALIGGFALAGIALLLLGPLYG